MDIKKPITTTITPQSYAKSLRKQGYRVLGSGLFADVFGKKGCDHVIKVVDLFDNDWNSDGYLAYLRLIDQTNPLFPRVKDVTRYNYKKSSSSRVDSRYYVVKMERLVEYDTVDWKKCVKVFNRLGVGSHYDFEETDVEFAPKLRVKYAQKAREVLHRLWKRYQMDIHDGNVMWRVKKGGTLQLVITDPATDRR